MGTRSSIPCGGSVASNQTFRTKSLPGCRPSAHPGLFMANPPRARGAHGEKENQREGCRTKRGNKAEQYRAKKSARNWAGREPGERGGCEKNEETKKGGRGPGGQGQEGQGQEGKGQEGKGQEGPEYKTKKSDKTGRATNWTIYATVGKFFSGGKPVLVFFFIFVWG